MPNANITIYLNDEAYVRYVQNKESLNKVAREAFKKELEKLIKQQ